MKGYASLNKALDGDGDWATIKDILRWVINTQWGTLALFSKIRLKIIYLMEIYDSQRCISVKNLERLIFNLPSMHLAMPGTIGYFYAIQE